MPLDNDGKYVIVDSEIPLSYGVQFHSRKTLDGFAEAFGCMSERAKDRFCNGDAPFTSTLKVHRPKTRFLFLIGQ